MAVRPLSCADPETPRGLPFLTATPSHLAQAWRVSASEGVFLPQRPHQAGVGVGEGHKAVPAVVGTHAAVPCMGETLRPEGP